MSTPRRRIPRRICPLCILGVELGGVMVATVLWERQASPLAWTALLLATPVWPYVAYLLTYHAADPYTAEVYNLLIGSALIATLVPLMHFDLLPSMMLLTLTMMGKATTDIRGLWMRALWVVLAAGVVSTVVMGLRWTSETSMCVIAACLPVMSLHVLSVSAVSYQLVRQSARQDQVLDELHRVDALTGLFGRGHWQEQVEAALHRCHIVDEPACMLMLDVDHFKEIGDVYGYTVGGEVICVLTHVVRGSVRTGDYAGRYDGGEFAIVLLDMYAHDALTVAQHIREQTEGVRLRNPPGLHITSSIGVVPADHRHSSLWVWAGAADIALYATKGGGRNQVVGCMEPTLVPAV